MPAPTRVLGVTPSVGWASSATPKVSPAFDVQVGDLIVLLAFSENGNQALAVPTWTGAGAWVQQEVVQLGSQWCTAYAYTCTVTATQTARTISLARGSTPNQFSFYASLWRNHGGVGIHDQLNDSGVPSLALAAATNSALVLGNSDWNAVDGTVRSWQEVNGSPIVETSYGGTAGSTYIAYTGYVSDSGAAGTKTVGLTAPAGQKYSIVGVEVLGIAGGSAFSGSIAFSGAGSMTASGAPGLGGASALDGSGALAATGSPSASGPVTLDGSGALTSSGTPSASGAVIFSSSGALGVVGSPELTETQALDGSGMMTTAGAPHSSGSVALTGAGTSSFDGQASGAASGTIALSGVGALEVSGDPGLAGLVSLVSTGILASVSTIHVAGSVQYAGLGTLQLRSEGVAGDIRVTASLGTRSKVGKLSPRRRLGSTSPNRWEGSLS